MNLGSFGLFLICYVLVLETLALAALMWLLARLRSDGTGRQRAEPTQMGWPNGDPESPIAGPEPRPSNGCSTEVGANDPTVD